jgi:hypothetical protein
MTTMQAIPRNHCCSMGTKNNNANPMVSTDKQNAPIVAVITQMTSHLILSVNSLSFLSFFISFNTDIEPINLSTSIRLFDLIDVPPDLVRLLGTPVDTPAIALDII